jgi:hypothetical protein
VPTFPILGEIACGTGEIVSGCRTSTAGSRVARGLPRWDRGGRRVEARAIDRAATTVRRICPSSSRALSSSLS